MGVTEAGRNGETRTGAWCPPIFRWAGSKRKLLRALIDATPVTFGTYFEPFVGSGCLFFALRPNRAVLGDSNAELICALRALKRHPRILHRGVANQKLTRRQYYRLRDKAQLDSRVTARAARFLALNRHCFNGLYRANSAGKFNVPYGTRTGEFPSEATFFRASIALRNAQVVEGDFADTVAPARSGDFVYLDPPYVYSGRRDRGEYGPGTFSTRDVDRLFATMHRLSARGVSVLLSFIECDEVVQRANGWHVQTLPVKRQISAFTEYRIHVNELLISNYFPRVSSRARKVGSGLGREDGVGHPKHA